MPLIARPIPQWFEDLYRAPDREPSRRPPPPPMPTNRGGDGFTPCDRCPSPVTCRSMGACYTEGH